MLRPVGHKHARKNPLTRSRISTPVYSRYLLLTQKVAFEHAYQLENSEAAEEALAASEALKRGVFESALDAVITIDTAGRVLEFNPAAERTFTLEADYRNHPQNPDPEQYEGQWETMTGTAVDPQATVYELTPNGEGQIYYFQKIDDSTLELIDPQRRRFENGEMLRLTRQ